MSDTHAKYNKYSFLTILLLIVFFPAGLFVMYRKTTWPRKVKHSITGLFAFFIIAGSYGAFVAPPTVKLDNSKNVTTQTTKASTYKITGDVYPYGSTLTVNGKSVANTQGKFAYEVPLKEGDNTVKVVATAHSKKTETSYSVHRTTTAEIAREKAEQKKLDDEQTAQAKKRDAANAIAAQKKAAADAIAQQAENQKAAQNAAAKQAAAQKTAQDAAAKAAATKLAADEKAAQKAQQAAAAQAKVAAANKPATTQDKLWIALDQSLKTRKGMKIRWNDQTKIAELEYSGSSFFNERDIVGTSYRQFVQWGKKVAVIPGVETIETHVRTEFIDAYGKESYADAVQINMQVSDFTRFNWDNLRGYTLHDRLRSTELGSLYIHPAISKKVDLNKVKLLY